MYADKLWRNVSASTVPLPAECGASLADEMGYRVYMVIESLRLISIYLRFDAERNSVSCFLSYADPNLRFEQLLMEKL